MSAARKLVIASQSVEARQTRAIALVCAALIVSRQDSPTLSAATALADEFQDYIDGRAPEPHADVLRK